MRDTSVSETVVVEPVCDPSLLNLIAWRERWAGGNDSEVRAQAALELAQTSQGSRNNSEKGLAHRTLAWIYKWRGEFDLAVQHCTRAEALLTERDHPAARGDIYSTLGVIHYSQNRMDLARSTTERGIQINAHDCPDDTLIDLLTTRATIQRYCGTPARAVATLDKARAMAVGRDAARVDHNIARGLLAEREIEKALELAEVSVASAIEHNNRIILPYAHEVAGACLAGLGRADAAAEHFDQGLVLAIEGSDRRAQCQIIRYHADIERKRGRFNRARDLYHHGLGLSEDLTYALWQKSFLLALAEVNEELGHLSDALENHKAAWRLEQTRRN